MNSAVLIFAAVLSLSSGQYPPGGGYPGQPNYPGQPGYPGYPQQPTDPCSEYIYPQRWCYSDSDCRSTYAYSQCDSPPFNPRQRACRCECGYRFNGRECFRQSYPIQPDGSGCWNDLNMFCNLSPQFGFIALGLLVLIVIFVVFTCLAVTCRR